MPIPQGLPTGFMSSAEAALRSRGLFCWHGALTSLGAACPVPLRASLRPPLTFLPHLTFPSISFHCSICLSPCLLRCLLLFLYLPVSSQLVPPTPFLMSCSIRRGLPDPTRINQYFLAVTAGMCGMHCVHWKTLCDINLFLAGFFEGRWRGGGVRPTDGWKEGLPSDCV